MRGDKGEGDTQAASTSTRLAPPSAGGAQRRGPNERGKMSCSRDVLANHALVLSGGLNRMGWAKQGAGNSCSGPKTQHERTEKSYRPTSMDTAPTNQRAAGPSPVNTLRGRRSAAAVVSRDPPGAATAALVARADAHGLWGPEGSGSAPQNFDSPPSPDLPSEPHQSHAWAQNLIACAPPRRST